jgi:predicted ribosome quality control (RQC) complex YloA/Tae2 family protein
MTTYEYYNLPDELNVEPLPEELFEDGLNAFTQALESTVLKAQEIKVAYVYDRNEWLTADTFGGKRNTSYSSGSDDVIIQVTLRVPNPARREELSNLNALETTLIEYNLNAEQERLKAEIAKAEEEVQKALATAAEKQKQLDALSKKK